MKDFQSICVDVCLPVNDELTHNCCSLVVESSMEQNKLS